MKILILRFSSLGDILLATTVLPLLKEQWPESTIDWVVKDKFKAALNSSLINKIWTFQDYKSLNILIGELKNEQYDLVFDLHRNLKSWLIRRNFKNVFLYEKRVVKRSLLVWFKQKYKIKPIPLMYCKALMRAGIDSPLEWQPIFDLDIDFKESVAKKHLSTTKLNITIAPGASYFTKCWPVERFIEVIEELVPAYNIILLGSGSVDENIGQKIKEAVPEVIDLISNLNFRESGAIIASSDLLICNDSGLLHLAECFKTPVVAIFGSTTEELGFFPYATKHIVVEDKSVQCRPCSHFGRRKCPQKHFDCMNKVTYEMVLDATYKLLEIKD